MEKNNITKAELSIMEKIWERKKMVTIAEVVDALQDDEKEWSYSTVSVLLTRLAEKKFVSSKKSGKRLIYYPLIDKAEFNRKEATNFVSKFGGTLKDLLSAFSGNKPLDKEEIEELKEWIKKIDD